MSARDRLAAVLARALLGSDLIRRYVEYAERANPTTMPEGLISDGHLAHDWSDELVAAIPEPVREAIEAALDRCAFASGDGTLHCGYPKDAQCHRQPDPTTGARMGRHMFVPLVAP